MSKEVAVAAAVERCNFQQKLTAKKIAINMHAVANQKLVWHCVTKIN